MNELGNLERFALLSIFLVPTRSSSAKATSVAGSRRLGYTTLAFWRLFSSPPWGGYVGMRRFHFHTHAARRGMLVWPRPRRRPEGGVCGYLDAEERKGSYHTQFKNASSA